MSSKGHEIATEVMARGAQAPAAVPGRYRVRLLDVQSPATPEVLIEPTTPSRLLVGKGGACDMVLDDPMVSRRHLSLDLAGPHLRVSDLGSTNGTYVNGLRIAEAFLAGGEVITIGSTRLQVEAERGAAPAARLPGAASFGKLVGASAAMRRLYPQCERLAGSDVPVIIEGETGTGKELLAESLHESGRRREGPFVVFDCSATSSRLAEGVLFGDDGTRGVFEQAHEGTLMIDEIAELPAQVQGRLLRAIDRGEVTRPSGEVAKVNVRVIATSRRDLDKEVEAARFREDLFFRLAVGRIELPPLRRRESDIPLLAEYFWKRLGGGDRAVPSDLLRRHEGYSWPGNVRELQNTVARRLALGDTDPDTEEPSAELDGAPEHAFRWVFVQELPFTTARDLVVSEFRRQFVERVLAQHGGNVSRAAAASGLARRYFQILKAKNSR